jgi:hypothetical protein
MATTISNKNINKPAPSLYRKFENAYFTVLSPAIGALIMGWGFQDVITNRLTLSLVVVGALIKGLGIVLANGERYTKF